MQAETSPATGFHPHTNIALHDQDWHNADLLRIAADLPGVRSTLWFLDWTCSGSLDCVSRNESTVVHHAYIFQAQGGCRACCCSSSLMLIL